MAVTISGVTPHSPAAKKRICPGDRLLAINGHPIEDVLDYRFYLTEERLTLQLETARGERTVHLRPDGSGDIGLEFETYLMDKQRACRNKCVFCFIDQLPPGMRESLYFKDDDSRLSFLFGNYITLTNLTEHDVQRIMDMHISPVNISIHTTDPQLRCRMMNNRFAGEALSIFRRLAEAGITINCQLVLCPGWNDGEALTRTMEDLAAYWPSVQSVAAVPVGLTKYRDGLEPLEPFTQETAADVVARMEAVGDRLLEQNGCRLFYPSDEFYLAAKKPIPPADFYGDFAQLENGVGMIALMRRQFAEAMAEADEPFFKKRLVIATGVSAAPVLADLVEYGRQKQPDIQAEVRAVVNRFFGERITVSGLITGRDIMEQLQGVQADVLALPFNMLRREGDCFLDDTTPQQVANALGIPVWVVDTDGAAFWHLLCCENGDTVFLPQTNKEG